MVLATPEVAQVLSTPQIVDYSRLPEAHELPNLIQLLRDSYEWFLEQGLRELFTEMSPISDFTGNRMELYFKDYRYIPAAGDGARVPPARRDLRRPAARDGRAAEQEDQRDQGAGALLRRPAAHDRDRHVHHQRRGARRGVAAGALAGRLLRRQHGRGDRSHAVHREADPEPRRVAGVRDQQPRHSDRQGRPQAQDSGHDAAAGARRLGSGRVLQRRGAARRAAQDRVAAGHRRADHADAGGRRRRLAAPIRGDHAGQGSAGRGARGAQQRVGHAGGLQAAAAGRSADDRDGAGAA